MKETKLEHKSTFDELIDLTRNYRGSSDYFRFIKFVAKIKNYSAYNIALIYAQDPNVTYVASKTDWLKKHNRTVKPEARPLIILAPFHPVMFVFDVNDTEGEQLPKRVFDPFWAKGELPIRALNMLAKLCDRLRVKVVEKPQINSSAGSIRTDYGYNKFRSYILEINSNHTPQVKFATLVHEIAHLLCGHLGVHRETESWRERQHLTLTEQEFEAESISYIICKRFGVRSNSEEYLSGYTKDNGVIPKISIDTVLNVTGIIENAIQGKVTLKNKEKTTYVNSSYEQLHLF
ncbi:ImmA/IrrE family metallo-endopeptidase [Vibrio sp. 1727]|uniref:ImmA/IrrE family metallo-endopeptidase n=1 Tax=Vibrio sp. 1727 TaxID=3074572 RepID=UPI00296678CD|nr:ImmA/IrrE family metallo-endopeptidase [Vibrio sp. 1727]MDW3114544.1 ImmA/IrrE family metallo-endopeptidase [Vibrio sp. 1727]